MKKVIYMKDYNDGSQVRTEKTCETFDDLSRTFDECTNVFRDLCIKYGTFSENDLIDACGEALGTTYRVMVVDE